MASRSPSAGLRSVESSPSRYRSTSPAPGALGRAGSASSLGRSAVSGERADRKDDDIPEVTHMDGQDLKVAVVEKSVDHIKLKISHVEASFANALRRVMISEVAILAVDTVEVHQNDSVIHDEMLVHRVAMLPLTTIVGPDSNRVNIADHLVYPRDCSCDSYCTKCSIRFRIYARCEKNQTRLSVTSFDMKNLHEGSGLVIERCQPVHHPHSKDTYPIVLVELAKGQEVDMQVMVRKGIGKEHSKWNPTCTVAMQYVPEVTLNERAFAELAQTDKQRWIRFCPRKVYSFDPQRNRVDVNPQNVNACFFCDECTNGAAMQQEPYSQFKGKKQLVAVRRKKDDKGRFEFFFTIETNGCMQPKEVLSEAWRVFYAKIADSVQCLDKNLMAAGRGEEIVMARHGKAAASRSGSRPTSAPGSPALSGGPSPAYTGSVVASNVTSMGGSAFASSVEDDIPWQ